MEEDIITTGNNLPLAVRIRPHGRLESFSRTEAEAG